MSCPKTSSSEWSIGWVMIGNIFHYWGKDRYTSFRCCLIGIKNWDSLVRLGICSLFGYRTYVFLQRSQVPVPFIRRFSLIHGWKVSKLEGMHYCLARGIQLAQNFQLGLPSSTFSSVFNYVRLEKKNMPLLAKHRCHLNIVLFLQLVASQTNRNVLGTNDYLK